MDDDEGMEPIPVLGHLCDGLREHFAASEGVCTPTFNEFGEIRGCDETNPTRIRFCPYCGTGLPEAQ